MLETSFSRPDRPPLFPIAGKLGPAYSTRYVCGLNLCRGLRFVRSGDATASCRAVIAALRPRLFILRPAASSSPMGKPQPQPKPPRRRLFFRCTRSRADDPQLAALARVAVRRDVREFIAESEAGRDVESLVEELLN
jgi:hypothetical protein